MSKFYNTLDIGNHKKIFVFQSLETSKDFNLYRLEIETQHEIVMQEFNTGWAARAASNPNDEIIKSGVNPDDIRKWNVLQNLQDRNETLFYK